MSEWTPEPWDRSMNVVYRLNDRGVNRMCAIFQAMAWAGAGKGEAEASAKRAKECVNAMAGRDPSKLAALEAAAESLESVARTTYWLGVPPRLAEAVDGIHAALKAFRGEE